MYERILVPLDGSKVGESVLPYVENLVSKLSPEVKVEVALLQVLSLVHPQVPAGYEGPRVPYTAQERREAQNKATSYLDEVGESLRNKGATVLSAVHFGDPSEEIVKVSEEIGADLIAMCTHGWSGLSWWALGGVTDKVLRRGGKVPILVVKAHHTD
jgi:nucleotide-binding universal stress UspA family protein